LIHLLIVKKVEINTTIIKFVNILSATEMKQEFQTALAKGLPFPILTITEYLSQDGEGFCWGRSYRLAGYYANILLW
jgi:dual oxidase maturation factor 1